MPVGDCVTTVERAVPAAASRHPVWRWSPQENDPDGFARAEAFWARMQAELLNRKKRRTRVELANAIVEHPEVSHNRRRRHSALGMRTPIGYEMLHQTRRSVA